MILFRITLETEKEALILSFDPRLIRRSPYGQTLPAYSQMPPRSSAVLITRACY